jgi:hypothetical protein
VLSIPINSGWSIADFIYSAGQPLSSLSNSPACLFDFTGIDGSISLALFPLRWSYFEFILYAILILALSCLWLYLKRRSDYTILAAGEDNFLGIVNKN